MSFLLSLLFSSFSSVLFCCSLFWLDVITASLLTWHTHSVDCRGIQVYYVINVTVCIIYIFSFFMHTGRHSTEHSSVCCIRTHIIAAADLMMLRVLEWLKMWRYMCLQLWHRRPLCSLLMTITLVCGALLMHGQRLQPTWWAALAYLWLVTFVVSSSLCQVNNLVLAFFFLVHLPYPQVIPVTLRYSVLPLTGHVWG